MLEKSPFFSVIIPTYDRPRPLAACLQALARLEYPRDRLEVIVVDDGSPTPLEAVIHRARAQLSVQLHTQPNRGPAQARNVGAARARGEFLAFTDDDCAPAPDWLRALALRFAGAPDCVIGGRTLNALPQNAYSTASQLLIAYLYAYYHTRPNPLFAGNNLAISRRSFLQIGGFDPDFPRAAAEDREFCDRWVSSGHRMIYAPEALVYHAHDLTFQTFWRQHFDYGRGALTFHQARARRRQEPLQVEPLSFYFQMLGYPYRERGGWTASWLAILLGVSQVAHTVGFTWEWARRTGARLDGTRREGSHDRRSTPSP